MQLREVGDTAIEPETCELRSGCARNLPLRHLDGGYEGPKTMIEWRGGKEMMGWRQKQGAEMRKRENRSAEADRLFFKGIGSLSGAKPNVARPRSHITVLCVAVFPSDRETKQRGPSVPPRAIIVAIKNFEQKARVAASLQGTLSTQIVLPTTSAMATVAPIALARAFSRLFGLA